VSSVSRENLGRLANALETRDATLVDRQNDSWFDTGARAETPREAASRHFKFAMSITVSKIRVLAGELPPPIGPDGVHLSGVELDAWLFGEAT
jgi:hypothetical protein